MQSAFAHTACCTFSRPKQVRPPQHISAQRSWRQPADQGLSKVLQCWVPQVCPAYRFLEESSMQQSEGVTQHGLLQRAASCCPQACPTATSPHGCWGRRTETHGQLRAGSGGLRTWGARGAVVHQRTAVHCAAADCACLPWLGCLMGMLPGSHQPSAHSSHYVPTPCSASCVTETLRKVWCDSRKPKRFI